MQDMKTDRNKEIAKILKVMDEAGFDVLSIKLDLETASPVRKENVYHLTIRIDKGPAPSTFAGVMVGEKADKG